MKKLIIALIISMMIPVAFAQKITGRWDCSKEMLQKLHFGTEEIYGTYKFKKNGTFVLKIKGETFDVDLSRVKKKKCNPDFIKRISVVIKGKYSLEDGKISTDVNPRDIECLCDFNGYSQIDNYVSDEEKLGAILTSEKQEMEIIASRVEKKVHNNPYFWSWHDEEVVCSGKKLEIGHRVHLEK